MADAAHPLQEGRDRARLAPSMPVLHLDGFDGPLDLLLDLAERQRIDLGRISILVLAEQFVAFMEQAQSRLPLERRADWLVVAARLVQLRSRLLFPQTPEAAAAAAGEAAAELQRLGAMAFVHAAARWLDGRTRLGIDVFTQPAPERNPRTESYMALMEACLAVLRGRGGQEAPGAYRPPPPGLWRVADAMAWIQARLAEHPAGGDLLGFLPGFDPDDPSLHRKARGAVASSLVAALEMAKAGAAGLEQGASFAPILLHAAGLPGLPPG